MRTIGCMLVVALAVTFATAAARAQASSKAYRVRVDAGFQSKLDVDQIEAAVLAATTAPIRQGAALEGDGIQVPPPPKIRDLVGCRGDDVPTVRPGLSRVSEPFVWVAIVRGSFSFPHIGQVDDHEGFVYVHPESGEVYRWGLLADSE